MVHLRLQGEIEVQSFFSRGSVEEDRFEIYGSEAKLTVDRHRFLNLEVSDFKRGPSRIALLRQGMRSLLTSPYTLDKVFAPTREPSYQAALAHFAAAVSSSDRYVSPNFWDGYRSLAIITAAEESARTGRVVSLPDVALENKHARARATRP
jgi:predicted dehydrogenase